MHLNSLAIAAAVLASYVLGSLWYLALGRSWRIAVGWTEGPVAYRPTPFELAVGLVGQIVIAVALAGLMGHFGAASVQVGAMLGGGIWLGFVLPTLATNVVFQRRSKTLLWQDGGHWLLILVTQGVVLGLFG